MDPEQLFNGISQELSKALKDMAKAKTLEERVQYSEIVRNLSDSMSGFLSAMTDLAPLDADDF